MASLQDIRDAVDTALTAASTDTIAIRPVQELDAAVNVSGSAVAALVQFAGANYLTVMGGEGDGLTFTITVAAPKTRAGRKMLDALVDPDPDSTTSLRNLINGSLGGVVAWFNVSSASGYSDEAIGEADYLTVDFTCDVGT